MSWYDGNSLMYLTTKSLILVVALTVTSIHAGEFQQLSGRVVRVVDGDTVVLETQNERHRIRLAGIDAPERKQPWGEASTRELRREIAGQSVLVEWNKRDRWKRLIGVIKLEKRDINKHMIKSGLAWHYKKYQREQTPEDRAAYDAAEKAAQGARRGLWSAPNPMPPWNWRRRK